MTTDRALRPAPSRRTTLATLRADSSPHLGFEISSSGRVCGLLTFAQYDRLFRVPHSREGPIVSGCTMEPFLGRISLPGPATAGRKSYYQQAIA